MARNKAAVVAAHSYDGWEARHETVNGWRTQIALVAAPDKVMEVWYDNLDHDVCVSGYVEYHEWTWCLEDVDQLVEGFARGLLPRPRPT